MCEHPTLGSRHTNTREHIRLQDATNTPRQHKFCVFKRTDTHLVPAVAAPASNASECEALWNVNNL